MNEYFSIETNQTPRMKSQFRFPRISKKDNIETAISFSINTPEPTDIFKSFSHNSKTPPLPYKSFRIYHQSTKSRLKKRKTGNFSVSSSFQSRLSKISLKEKITPMFSKKTNKIELKNKKPAKVQQKFGNQPKALPPAKAKVDYGIKFKPAINYGDKVWRLSQLASLEFDFIV